MQQTLIGGGWVSLDGLTYVITQVGDKFVWSTVHQNGLTETGIGKIMNEVSDVPADGVYPVEAQWNFDGGRLGKPVTKDNGKILVKGGNATAIEWEDKDHFYRPMPQIVKN